MKERIILLIKAKNLTAAQFADEIGVQKSSISHIISGRNNASLDFIQKILFRYPEVNMDWLMFGKGPLFKGQNSNGNTSNDEDLHAVPTSVLPPVDLFSEVITGIHQENRKENRLIPDQVSEEKSKQADIKNISNNPLQENKPEVETATYIQKLENKTESAGHKNNSTKILVKIVEFYSDNTFKEFYPE
jgi:transcriptional regulator with XRE-family HTH domain